MNQSNQEFSKDEVSQLIKQAVQDAVKSSLPANEQRSNNNSFEVSASEKLLEKRLSNSSSPKIETVTKSAKEGGHIGNLPVHERQLANILLRKDPFHGLDQVKNEESKFRKDFDATTVGAGLDYVPVNLTGALLRDLELQPSIHSLFEMIQTSAKVEKRPNWQGNVNYRLRSTDAASVDIGNQTTGQTTLTNQYFSGYVDYSVDLNDQSVVALLPEIQAGLVRAWSRNLDDMIINGDDSGTHQDNDTELLAADYHLRAWKGLRKFALDVPELIYDGTGAALDTDDLVGTLKLMKKYSVRLNNIFLLVSGPAQFSLFPSQDWKDSTLMLANWGSKEEIGRGLVGYVMTTPVYNSEFVRSDVSSTGVNGVGGNTLTTALAVHKDMFKISMLKDIRINVFSPDNSSEMARLNVHRIFAGIKGGFNPVFTPAVGKEVVAVARNIDD